MTSLIVASSILFFVIAVRGRWLHWKLEEHQLKSVWFCWRTKQPPAVLLELLETWPVRNMLWELWNWKFKRYVVHHDHFDEMVRFVERELARNDITLEMMKEAQEEYSKDNKI